MELVQIDLNIFNKIGTIITNFLAFFLLVLFKFPSGSLWIRMHSLAGCGTVVFP